MGYFLSHCGKNIFSIQFKMAHAVWLEWAVTIWPAVLQLRLRSHLLFGFFSPEQRKKTWLPFSCSSFRVHTDLLNKPHFDQVQRSSLFVCHVCFFETVLSPFLHHFLMPPAGRSKHSRRCCTLTQGSPGPRRSICAWVLCSRSTQTMSQA